MLLEEARRGAKDVAGAVDQAGDEFARFHGLHADRDVHAALDEVVDLVVERGDDAKLGVKDAERRQRGPKHEVAHGDRCLEPDFAAFTLGEGGFRFADLLQDRTTALVVLGAFRGQANVARRSLQKRHAKMGLELARQCRDRGIRDAELGRCPRHAARIDRANEGLHGHEPIHRVFLQHPHLGVE